LSEHFGECIHVNKTELPNPAKDSEIWKYAAENGYAIITRDSEFLHLFEAKGFPPILAAWKRSPATGESILTF
jgi:predicted nuclease of predicted toxin-antitoxin system